MSQETTYELICDACGADYELSYIENDDSDEPMYCPFCGSDIDLTDIEEESELDDEELDFSELDFEKDY